MIALTGVLHLMWSYLEEWRIAAELEAAGPMDLWFSDAICWHAPYLCTEPQGPSASLSRKQTLQLPTSLQVV